MDLTSLNKKQKEAVETISSPVMIIAGPGTGKTKTLTTKIAYLLENEVAPQEILALTFTKKAADEMKYRVNEMVSGKVQLPFIGTFHAFAYQFLKQKGFTIKIVSDRERKNIIEGIKSRHKNYSSREIETMISFFKNSLTNKPQGEIRQIVETYDQALSTISGIDYDDLLQQLNLALKNDPKYFSYILIDEFQDINDLQYEIIRMLNVSNTITVIGDPRQCIYSFRGSSTLIFDRFKENFPNSKKIFLDVNYRSAPQILSLSHSLFPKSPILHPYKDDAGKTYLVTTFNEYSESDFIISLIGQKIGGLDLNSAGNIGTKADDNIRFSDFAVIYRTRELKSIIEKKFRDSGIPYQIAGEDSPYARRDLRFITDCLRYLVLSDNESLQKISEAVPMKLLPAIKSSLDQLRGEPKVNITQVINTIIELYPNRVMKDNALQEYQNTASAFIKYHDAVIRFINYITDLENKDYYDHSADKVTLLTVHSAKGLEFSYVCIIGFEKDYIPHKRATTPEEIEEEKRLLYVALTRAKKDIYLICTQKRHGHISRLSPFANYFSSKVIEYISDPALEKIKKKILKNKVKQIGLF